MSLYERAQRMQGLINRLLPYVPMHMSAEAYRCLDPLPSPDSTPTAGKYPSGPVHDPAPSDVVTDAGKPRDVGGHHI